MKEFFDQLKSKQYSRKQYAKCYLMHDTLLDNIVKTLKEELDGFNFFIRAQPIQSTSVETAGWFMYLYLDLYLCDLQALMKSLA